MKTKLDLLVPDNAVCVIVVKDGNVLSLGVDTTDDVYTEDPRKAINFLFSAALGQVLGSNYFVEVKKRKWAVDPEEESIG